MHDYHHNYKPHYIHHQDSSIQTLIREIVFGLEDGMVSTLGSITGIAIGSRDHYTVMLAGLVIISVESISMGIGSYLSNRSEEEVKAQKLHEEKTEIKSYPDEETKELLNMYIKDGWPENLARDMVQAVTKNPPLMLKEMALRELEIFPSSRSYSIKGGLYMFGSYIAGGLLPLLSYIFLPVGQAVPASITITLLGLFALGAGTTKYTKQPLIKSGFRMMVIGGVALFVGLIVGLIFKQ